VSDESVAQRAAEDIPPGLQRQAAAQEAYLVSVEEGRALSGAELGRRFGRTDRWGRYQISKVKADGAGTNGHRSSRPPAIRDANGNGRDPMPTIRERPITDTQAESTSACRNGRSSFRDPAHPADGSSDSASQARECRSWLDVTITLIVALVAAAASYGHMLEVALVAGEHVWIAKAFPITVDGLVLAALRRGEEGRGWLALGAAVSVAANVLAQFPDQAAAAGPIVSAWPPLALYGTHRLLHGRRWSRSAAEPRKA
jgi:hypothetical protein